MAAMARKSLQVRIRNLTGGVVFLLALGLVFPASASARLEKENFWPFWDRRTEPISGARETGILGPLFHYAEKEQTKQYGVRPLFFIKKDARADTTEVDILYPLATYRREGKEKRLQILQLFSIKSEAPTIGPREEGVTLFPFIFYKKSEEEKKGYFALFPFYGTLRDKFGRDEIRFYLFPLYSTARRKDVISRNYFWPFVSVSRGEKQRSFRVWPFYGFSEKQGSYSKRFILWPFIMWQRTGLDSENPKELFTVLPFYARMVSKEREYTSILWPFFSHVVDRKREYSQWNLPFPIFSYASGIGRQTFRLWPLFGRDQRPGRYSFFLLWPVYIYTESEDREVSSIRHRFLFVLYSDLKQERRRDGLSRRRLDMWPLFTYRREEDGSRSFQLLSILAPLLPGLKGIERNLSPLWALYRYRQDAEGNVTHSLLWHLIYRERGAGYSRWEILGPLLTLETKEKESSFSILKGLFGFGRKEGRSYLRLFYYFKLRGFW